MPADPLRCGRCGDERVTGATLCPTCGTPYEGSSPPDESGAPASESPAARPGSLSTATLSPSNSELDQRIARLQQWAEASAALGGSLPVLPSWAVELARGSNDGEPWSEVLRGVERLAQKKVVQALTDWERLTKNRLGRLEAYAVDGRLEREQMEDLLHLARTGEIAQALSIYQQVERVVTLKERHLDQAREELERLISLMRDMQALDLPAPQDPAEIAEDLERELRGGRLAPLKQQLRALRQQAMNRLKVGVPHYVTEYGDFLVGERNAGLPIELEAAELARGAREFHDGKPEEALRRLRVLAQVHGAGPVRPARSPAIPEGAATGEARTTEASRRA